MRTAGSATGWIMDASVLGIRKGADISEFPRMCAPSFCTWKFYLNETVWVVWDSGSLIRVSGVT